jgi:hypothetical protein
MRAITIGLASVLTAAIMSSPTKASPPPPPPEYVYEASNVLKDATNKEQTSIAPLFANDVAASLNGKSIASNKDSWLQWWAEDRAHYYGRTLGYSMGWKDDGVLLVLDEYDTQDNASKPPPPGDPRPSTRSTLYHFGSDGLIHSVFISEVNSYMRGLSSYLDSFKKPGGEADRKTVR